MLLNKIYNILISADSYCRVADAEMQIPSKDVIKIKIIDTKRPVMVQMTMTRRSKKH
jgi:uncharacterized protein (DUF342 family)